MKGIKYERMGCGSSLQQTHGSPPIVISEIYLPEVGICFNYREGEGHVFRRESRYNNVTKLEDVVVSDEDVKFLLGLLESKENLKDVVSKYFPQPSN